MTKPDELQSVWMDKMECILMNTICMCMHNHDMTLECLDRVYEKVCDFYRKNAKVPHNEG